MHIDQKMRRDDGTILPEVDPAWLESAKYKVVCYNSFALPLVEIGCAEDLKEKITKKLLKELSKVAQS